MARNKYNPQCQCLLGDVDVPTLGQGGDLHADVHSELKVSSLMRLGKQGA
jgi:hypothetical protein